jgi:hypothetical protein
MSAVVATNRWKDYRQRLKAGRVVLSVEVDQVETVEALIAGALRVRLVSLCLYRSLVR